MPAEMRYAVARDEYDLRDMAKPPTREWWQLKDDRFARECDTRRLFARQASALAVIWAHRDQNHHHGERFKYVLVRVMRSARTAIVSQDSSQPVQGVVP